MQDKPVLLTPEGLQKLQDELNHLINERRPEIALRIKHAKEFGDLSENAEYEDAKNDQGFIEGRIMTVEQMIRNASLIDTGEKVDGFVHLGSTVGVKDEFGETSYVIVGSAEADAGSGKISLESPVGKALMGRRTGEEVDVETPGGPRRVRILQVA
ncbi:MAG TPA: transcription elongation factor GreA [Candidatus Dormibacteraeota bacterium]|nr:transcription elongation factor GreA [Candidatus Dormibacteraeota bacterium]